MSKIQEIATAVAGGKMKIVGGLIDEALAEGIAATDILNEGLIAAMSIVGDQFKDGQIYVPEMLVAARAMKKGVEKLKPHLAGGVTATLGKFIIGTVEGDLHDIGKNLVGMMLEGSGFEVVDLGVDVPSAKIIDAIKANPDCRIVGLTALLTTTMPALKDAVSAIAEAGLKNQVKIIVGGAPITQEFADKIGADGYAENAASAASISKKLIA
ncbi:corrinoid protein [Sporomusa sp. KB1]|jgi:corrinoid protein of di/trimethylamine methyltransferase|uniref:corrinoid protein n=1 Tax=Sporomusa sp. KB1 TaxID=943346 RepID=UPI0011A6B2C4|nr:corrinoid protein [Sporomusa sp. KB1]TWH46077.1 corrinoid protein of di/trimethylamine methyltransferase [Sporomusa sp. KB1]